MAGLVRRCILKKRSEMIPMMALNGMWNSKKSGSFSFSAPESKRGLAQAHIRQNVCGGMWGTAWTYIGASASAARAPAGPNVNWILCLRMLITKLATLNYQCVLLVNTTTFGRISVQSFTLPLNWSPVSLYSVCRAERILGLGNYCSAVVRIQGRRLLKPESILGIHSDGWWWFRWFCYVEYFIATQFEQ